MTRRAKTLGTALGLGTLAILSPIILSACASAPGDAGGTYEVVYIQEGNRTIPCVLWDSDYAGGITCDWNASKNSIN